jgi:hypothetical protein
LPGNPLQIRPIPLTKGLHFSNSAFPYLSDNGSQLF